MKNSLLPFDTEPLRAGGLMIWEGGRPATSVLTQFEILGSAFDRRKLRGIDAADGGGGP